MARTWQWGPLARPAAVVAPSSDTQCAYHIIYNILCHSIRGVGGRQHRAPSALLQHLPVPPLPSRWMGKHQNSALGCCMSPGSDVLLWLQTQKGAVVFACVAAGLTAAVHALISQFSLQQSFNLFAQNYLSTIFKPHTHTRLQQFKKFWTISTSPFHSNVERTDTSYALLDTEDGDRIEKQTT